MSLFVSLSRIHGRLQVGAFSPQAIQRRQRMAFPAQYRQRYRTNAFSWSGSITSNRLNKHEPFRFTRTFHDSSAHAGQLYSSAQPQSLNDNNGLILEGLNEAQVEAVTQPLSSVTRVVAGPGAGKTRVLTSRIAYLLHNDENDNRILAVTFTKKAAGEMQQRLEKLLEATSPALPQQEPDQQYATNDDSIVQEEVADARSSPRPLTALDRVTLGTFHSVCAKILRRNGKRLAELPSVIREMTGSVNATVLDGNFNIIDQNEQIRVIKECQADLEMDLKNEDLKPMTVLNAMATVKSKLAMGVDPLKKDGNKPPPKAIRVASRIFPVYRQKLLARNSLDFDDLILMARELLDVHEDIRDLLRRRWTHVLVDEFQDTSRSQLDLVKLLSTNSLLVVGDADQSIYSWRGAHVESMSDFIHEFNDRLDGVRTVFLMENYRSTTNIVNIAQKIISSDSKSSKQSDLRQDMKPMRGSGPTPRILACADAKAEATFVIKTLQDMIESGDYTPDSSVAIIYRTNAQSRALEEACVHANMPYVVRGSSGSFYKRAEIQDCLCFLRLLHNGRDETAMKRAIKTPSRGIGDVAFKEFKQYCTEVDAFYESNYPDQVKPTPLDILISLSDEQDDSGESVALVPDVPSPSETISKRALNRFLPFSMQMRLIWTKAQTLTVAGLLSSIIVNLELRNHIDSISKSKAEFSDRWSNVIELRRAAQRYSDDGASTKLQPPSSESSEQQDENYAETPLGNFLDDVALVTDLADDEADANSESKEKKLVVSLMTIHASKGMEFDGVFLVGNEDGTLPTRLAIKEGEGSVALDEEKRLCYVAMTRAKTHLVMTWRREVSSFNGQAFTTVNANRSRFLDVLVANKGKKKKTAGDTNNNTKMSSSKPSSVSRPSTLPRSGAVKPPPRVGAAGASNARRGVGTNAKQATKHAMKRGVKPNSRMAERRKTNTAPRKVYNSQVQAILSTTKESGSTREERRPQMPDKATDPDRSMDSTWFYPIGTEVVHSQHGKGKVLPPPQRSNGELLVRVQFEDGTKHDLPAVGNDLHLNLKF